MALPEIDLWSLVTCEGTLIESVFDCPEVQVSPLHLTRLQALCSKGPLLTNRIDFFAFVQDRLFIIPRSYIDSLAVPFSSFLLADLSGPGGLRDLMMATQSGSASGGYCTSVIEQLANRQSISDFQEARLFFGLRPLHTLQEASPTSCYNCRNLIRNSEGGWICISQMAGPHLVVDPQKGCKYQESMDPVLCHILAS
jgi:hypothetical protein